MPTNMTAPTTIKLETERAANDLIMTSGFTRDEADRYSTWKNAQGDEAHVHRAPDKSGWTVTVRTAAEVAELERETAIASLLYNLTSEVERGRDEVKSAIERVTRNLGQVTERFEREPRADFSPAEDLRHALSLAAGELMSMSRVLAEAATRAESATKAQENLIRSAGFLVHMMSRVRGAIAASLVECGIEVRS